MSRVSKGQYGYIQYRRRISLLQTIIFFAVALGIFAAGMIITGSRKNIATILAALACLPAARSAVGTIMYMRAGYCSEEAHTRISDVISDGKPDGLYDIYLTSYSANYAMSHVCVWAGSVIGLCESGADVSPIEKHITEHMAVDGYKNYTVKVFSDIGKYCDRLKALGELDAGNTLENCGIYEMLMAISL